MKIEHRFRLSNEAAKRFYEETFDPPEHEYLYYDALNYIDDGLYKEAEECINKAIELCSDNPFYIEVKDDLLKRRSCNVDNNNSNYQGEDDDEDNSNSKLFFLSVIAVCIGCFFWWYNSSQKDTPNPEVMVDTLTTDTVAVEKVEEDYGTFPTNPDAFIGDGQCFDLRGHAMYTEGMYLILGKDGRIMLKPQEEEDSLSTPNELTDIKRNPKGQLLSFLFMDMNAFSLDFFPTDFVYNKEGLVESIHEKYVRGGDKRVFTYNKQGYIIEEKHYESYLDNTGNEPKMTTDVSQYKYRYKEFDSHGNWIQRIRIEEGVDEYVETREITYY